MPDATLSDDQCRLLMRMEHDLWLREHLLQGYEWAPVTQDALRLHRDIVNYDDLAASEQPLDQPPILNILEKLRKHGYVLVKAE